MNAQLPTGEPGPGAEPRDPGLAGDEGGIGLLDLALVLAENLRLLVLAPLGVGLVAVGISFAIAPTYTARTVIMPPQQQQSSAAASLQNLGALASLAGLAGGGAGIKSPADQYVALMQSVTVANRLIGEFKLGTVYETDLSADARAELERNTRIGASKKDGLITIEVDDHDPARAAALANAYVDQLRKLTSELAVTEAQQRRVFFDKQLELTKDKFTLAQRAVQAAGINEGALRAEPRAAAEGYAKLRADVTAAELRLQSMRGYFAETAPEFVQARGELAALRAQLAKAEAVNVGASTGDYLDRYREFKYQERLYELFVSQLELAKLDESREAALIQVVDPATPPERKSKPKKATIAVMAALGTLLALLLWIVVRLALRTPDDDLEAAGKLRAVRESLRRSVGASG